MSEHAHIDGEFGAAGGVGGSGILPVVPEIEAAVLQMLAQAPERVRPLLREENVDARWFGQAGHGRLYGLLVGELELGRALTFPTLAARVRDEECAEDLALYRGQEEAADVGMPALHRLWDYSPEAFNLGQYLDAMRERFIARELARACRETLRAIESDWTNAGTPMVRAMTSALQVLSSHGVRLETVRHIKEFLPAAVVKVQEAFYSRGHTFGVPTGIPRLDRQTNGLRAGFTYYICGRPGSGKSAFMCHLLTHATALLPEAERVHGLIFSLEMTGLQLATRELLKVSEVPLQRARDGLMSEERDFPKMIATCTALAKGNLWLDETSVVTMDDISARARRFVRKIRGNETPEQFAERKKKDRPDIILALDYIQRAKGSDTAANQGRYRELAELAQGISALAKDLHVAFVVLCQLGRPEVEGPFHFPKLSDLRESGDLEAEAHVVIACHRPISYVMGNEGKMHKAAETLEIEVGQDKNLGARDLHHYAVLCLLKQREGPVGPVPVHFEPSLTSFSGWDRNEKLFSNNAEQRQTTAAPADTGRLGPSHGEE